MNLPEPIPQQPTTDAAAALDATPRSAAQKRRRAALQRASDRLAAVEDAQLLPMMFRFLASRSQVEAEVAERLFVGMGGRLLPALIAEVLRQQHRPERCLRILRVLEQIEPAPEMADRMLLIGSMMNPEMDRTLRHRMGEILQRWRRQGDGGS